MPTLKLSTYMADYVLPQLQRSRRGQADVKPIDCLSEAAGRRLLPTTFDDFYKNCVSASIGDRLELQFTDDTPQWKRDGRAAAAVSWVRPLDERREFVRTKMQSGRGDRSGGGGGGGGGSNGDENDSGGAMESLGNEQEYPDYGQNGDVMAGDIVTEGAC